MARLRWILLLLRLALPSTAWAAFITTPEAGMDSIYGQGTFGANTIDIRFNPTITYNDPTLLTIDSNAKLNTLFGIQGATPTVFMYFVDDISFCGGVSDPLIVGCADQPGNDIVVESAFMASALGDELAAHELGHNLGLEHIADINNLMNPTILASTTGLTGPGAGSQVATIFMDPAGIIQSDVSGYFISITPVLITPEPGILLLLGVLVIAAWRRSRRDVRS